MKDKKKTTKPSWMDRDALLIQVFGVNDDKNFKKDCIGVSENARFALLNFLKGILFHSLSGASGSFSRAK